MTGRTRTGRALVALGLLTMAVGLNVSVAAASGEVTTAVLTSPLSGSSSTFTWSYEFDSNGGHELSNIAIGFCSADILPLVVSATPAGEMFLVGDVPGGHTGFGPGMKFATTAVSGTLTVVFSQPQVAGGSIQVQSHSGDGQDGDEVTTAAGPGSCIPTTTTTAAPTTTTVAPTTTTVAPTTTTSTPATTTSAVPATTTTVAPTTTTSAPVATTSTVPATTTSVAANSVSTTTTTVPLQTTTSVPTSVLGARFTNDDTSGGLATTGFNGAPLVAFGVVLVMLGLTLVVGELLQPSER